MSEFDPLFAYLAADIDAHSGIKSASISSADHRLLNVKFNDGYWNSYDTSLICKLDNRFDYGERLQAAVSEQYNIKVRG